MIVVAHIGSNIYFYWLITSYIRVSIMSLFYEIFLVSHLILQFIK